VSHKALLEGGSDVEFRRLVYRLVLVEERLRHARAYFGRLIGLTGPQYMLLVTVLYLQGEDGITVRALARNLRVSSAFIASESQRLVARGLLARRANPADSRSTLLSVTAAGRRRIARMLPEVRAVNDLFFEGVTRPAFRAAQRFLDQLLDGSARAMARIDARAGAAAVRRAKNGGARAAR
jgi:DNA-binding MarR family transcriptional regulator